MNLSKFYTPLFVCLSFGMALSQEGLRPLYGNINLHYRDLQKAKPASVVSQQKKAGLSIPFKDDFHYAHSQNFADPVLWSIQNVYVNTGHGIAPPSVGVATFDGLNRNGWPYTPALTNMSQSLPADTLTSASINLHTAGAQTLQPVDSVALIFYYQARGFGDAPESTDSLLVDFYMPLATVNIQSGTVVTVGQGKWVNVWFSRGNSNPNTNDTIFKRGFVRVLDTAYFHDGFKFRFRNKATTSGDFDHWHLDYVYFDKGRSFKADTTYDDMAFGYVPRPLLFNYAEMPWNQYTPAEKTPSLNVFIRNNGGAGQNIQNMTYEYRLQNAQSNLTYTNYSGGAISNLQPFKYSGWSTEPNHARPAFDYTFSAFTDSMDFKVKHFIYDAGSADFFPENDTVLQYQRFRNYYAFDDGSAEAAYFVTGPGAKIVQRIHVNTQDTMRSLRIYFDPIGSVALVEASYSFQIVVFNSSNGLPAERIWKDSLQLVNYMNAGPDVSAEYTLTTPLPLSPGTYYIGIQQKVPGGGPGPPSIGIGFDKNLNHSDKLYYDNGTGWTQSQIAGSLMMRPVIGKASIAPVGVKENELVQGDPVLAFPNPASETIRLSSAKGEQISYRMISVTGQTVSQSSAEGMSHQIGTASLEEGIYFLLVYSQKRLISQRKVIIRH